MSKRERISSRSKWGESEEGGNRTVLERGHALERDFEEVRVCELGGVVQDGDIAVRSTRFERAGEWENEGSCEDGTKTHVMLMMLILSVAVSALPAVRVRARTKRVEMKRASVCGRDEAARRNLAKSLRSPGQLAHDGFYRTQGQHHRTRRV